MLGKYVYIAYDGNADTYMRKKGEHYMEIIKIAPETLEALQNAPCAQPPHPLPMAEVGEAVKDATEVWGYLSAANAPKETRRAFERVCERAGVPYIIDKAGR